MHHVLNILLPHVRRFRSLAILTDRWAPMQTALDCLSMEISAFVSAPSPLPSSLPMLETLVLMRCNEFVSYHSEFSPADRKDPTYLPFSALLHNPDSAGPVLPGLKKLQLSGVHMHWPSLPLLLHQQHSPLETLDLSYHCSEVRPSERDFRALLERCPKLRTLNVRVSGPKSPDSAYSCRTAPEEDTLSMPALETVILGYDDPYTAATMLDMLDAPNVRHLMLEDSSCPEDRSDATPLLQACTVSSVHARLGMPPFPRVAALSLHRVDASAETFEALYGALPALRSLSVSQMFLLGGKALRPDVELSFEPLVLSTTGSVAESVQADGELVANKLTQPWEPAIAGVRPAQRVEMEITQTER